MSHNTPPQNNGNPFQQQPPQPQPQKSNNTVLYTIIGLLVAIIVVGGLFFFVQSNNEEDSSPNAAETSETTESSTPDDSNGSDSRASGSRDSKAAFNVGDCLPESFGYSNSLVKADDIIDCSSPEAVYELVDETTESNPISCLDIPAAVNAVEDFAARGEKVAYCVIDKTIDPDTSINQAKVGECVNLNDLSVDNIQKIDCADRYAARITSVVDEAMPGLNESKNGGQDIPEDTIIKFCQDHGTPEPVGYYSLDFTFTKKDARTWCFSA